MVWYGMVWYSMIMVMVMGWDGMGWDTMERIHVRTLCARACIGYLLQGTSSGSARSASRLWA